MKKILSTSIKNVWKVLAAIIIVFIINLAVIGHVELLPAVLIGCVLAAAYIISTAARLSSIVGLSKEQAKRRMLIGLLLRIAMVLVVLLVGLKISQLVFFAMVSGFLTFYVVAHIGLITTSYQMSYHNGDDVGEK